MLGLKEPKKEHAAHLSSSPGAGLLLAEGSDYGMVLVVGQERLGYAVPDGGILLVELGSDALDAELLLPQPGHTQQAQAGGDAQTTQKVPVEPSGIV